MLSAFLPENESERLSTLRDLLILDTPPESRFDSITQYAADLFNVPIALVSLVDENRQWFKSRCGLDATETPRDISFCGHAIHSDDVLLIEDTLEDARFADNPLVTNDPKIRFYAGAPLIMKNGQRIGTFCVIGREPKKMTDWELGHLKDLAKVVALEIQGIDAAKAFLEANPKASR